MPANLVLTADERRFVEAMQRAGGSVGAFTARTNVELARAQREADYFTRRFQQGFGRVGDSMQGFGQNMSTYVTLPLAAAAVAAGRAYGEFDSMRRGIEYVDGAGKATTNTINELFQASKAPGLGFQESLQRYTGLRALDFQATEAKRIIAEVANANAITGGGKTAFDTIIFQLTQMASKGKVLSEDLKPIISASPAIAKAIKTIFGTVNSEDISGKLKAQGKDTKDFIALLVNELAKGPRVAGSFKTALENVSDAMFVAGSRAFEAADKNFLLTDAFNGLSDTIGEVAQGFSALPGPVQASILTIATLAAGIGPASYAIGILIARGVTLASTWATVSTGFAVVAPWLLAAAAILSVVAVTVDLVNSNKELQAAQNAQVVANNSLIASHAAAVRSVESERDEVNRLLAVARDHTKSVKERQAAVKAMNQISPEFLGNLKLENIEQSKTTAAVFDYINALELRAEAEDLINKKKKASDDLAAARGRTDASFIEFGDKIAAGARAAEGEASTTSILAKVGQEKRNAAIFAAETEWEAYSTRLNQLRDRAEKKGFGLKPPTPAVGDFTGSATGDGKKKRDDTDKLLEQIAGLQTEAYNEDVRTKIAAAERKAEVDRMEVARSKASEELKAATILAINEKLAVDLEAIRQKGKTENAAPTGLDPFSGTLTKTGAKISPLDAVAERAGMAIQKLTDATLDPLDVFNARLNEQLKQMAGDAFVGMSEMVAGLMAGTVGASEIPAVLGGILGGMFQQMGKAYISQGLISTKLIPTLTNPITAGPGLLAAGVAMSVLGALLRASTTQKQPIKRYYTSGVPNGPALAYVNDYATADTDPEAIARLSLLRSMISTAVSSTMTRTLPQRSVSASAAPQFAVYNTFDGDSIRTHIKRLDRQEAAIR